VFAGCVKSQAGGAQELRELNLKRLHVIQMDVTSDEQVAAAAEYVSRHIPPQGICMSDLCSNNGKVYDLFEGESNENLRYVLSHNLLNTKGTQ